jgi:hypothetical protein
MVRFFRKKKGAQILLRIIEEPYDTSKRLSIIKSSDGLKNEVIVEPTTENKAGWRVDVTGCIRPNSNGELTATAFRGSPKAIKFDTTNSQATLSRLTSDEQQAFINLKIFKAHYGNILKDLLAAIKPYLIVLAIVVCVAVAISGYNAYILSKIPAIMMPVAP